MRLHTIAVLLATLVLPASLAAQGHGNKHYDVDTDRAYVVTHDVLGRHGFEVVRIENVGDDRVIWYRRGNNGRGKGKGPLAKMIIRRVPAERRVVFVDAPSDVLADIDVRLNLR
ncbi:MAG TPA: hypothetical protein VNG04_02130 [Candidatus Acidoferrum sp.]|nr:hypothetical protein [Candidatus Acidoferrum sp.]